MNKLSKISDDMLVAYLDGEGNQQDRVYIETHPDEFAARLAALQASDHELQNHLRGFRPISALELGQYHLGLCDAKTEARIVAYLAQHPHAAKTVELLGEYLIDLEPEPLVRKNLLTKARIMVAKLLGSADAPGVLALGLRGEQDGIYVVDDYQVVIDTDSDFDDPTKFALTGLLTGYDQAAALQAHLWQTDTQKLISTSPLDEFGNFGFTRLDAGCYELIISGDNAEIEIHLHALEL